MKKLFFSIMLAVVAMAGMAQTIGEAFYIYRNDSCFNAFYRDEVDSITYSFYDADSVSYNDIVTQIIYTRDSIYHIPLAAIDSVSFVTPKTQYKTGVVKIEGDLRSHLLDVRGDTLVFDINIPSKIIPHVGDKLTTLEMSNLFPIGFAGEVIKVDKTERCINVIYEDVELDEVFDCLFITGDSPAKSARKMFLEGHGKKTLNLGPYTINWVKDLSVGVELQKDYAFSFSPQLTFTYTPKFWVSGMVIITKEIGHYFSFTCTGEHEFEEIFAATGNLSFNKKAGLNLPAVKLGICQFLELYFEPGLFFKAEAELSSSMTFTQRHNTALHYEWCSKGNAVGKNDCKVVHVSSDVTGQMMLNGSISTGAYFEIGVQAFNRPYLKKKNNDWGTLKANIEIGCNVESNAVLSKVETDNAKKETKAYERLKDTTFKLSKYWATSISFKPVPWFELTVPLPLGKKQELKRWGHVPVFERTTSNLDGEFCDLLKATTNASGQCFRPVNVGFVLKNSNGDELGRHLFNTPYQWNAVTLEYMFSNIHSNSQLTVYPLVKWNGIEMIATPSSFSCPDSNHPHMIDLGLPSGTKWACCNVGASTPEGYGNYYACGETQSKSVYNWETYAFWHDNGDHLEYDYYDFEQIGRMIITPYGPGRDIAGSIYDAATANWGAPWRMPSVDQIRELVKNTTSEWTTENGVYGGKFTGSNGSTVFFPAAGERWNSDLYEEGRRVYCLSSTLYYGWNPPGLYGLVGESRSIYDNYFIWLCCGAPVRPVQ